MEKERAMQNILVAIDGLPGSEKALEAAVQQAQLKDGGITALAVLDHGGIPSLPILDRSSDPELKRILERAKVQARRHLEETLEAAVNFARSRGVQLTGDDREVTGGRYSCLIRWTANEAVSDGIDLSSEAAS
jgi:nucleotide-binding universal stress UspA family protein